MEMTYITMERDARLATEIARALWSGEEERPFRGGLNIDETLEVLLDDLKWYTECMAESDGDLRDLYAAKIAETEATIRETEAEIAERAAIMSAEDRPKPPTERQAASRTVAAKVCGIANKIPRSVSRKEAFTLAWAIVRDGWLEISVAGTLFGSRQEALRKLATYDPKKIIVLLVPEPDCKHDPEAIAVKVMVNGGKGIYTLGYVPRTETGVARAFLGAVPELRLVGGETKGARIRLAA